MENRPPLARLNPADLLRQGVAEDTFMEGPPSFSNPPPIEELAPLFPQFEILELIGKGGMGAVYKVRQKDLDRIVALKILPPAIGQSEAFSSRFTREAKALAKLNHPGIVTIHEFGQRDGLYFILMEFVDGVNLAQLMKTGRVSPREALAIVPQICDALQFAHDQGIVHRDIKPENILLDRLGRVKVADFGIAKVVAAAREKPIRSGDTPVPTDATLAGKIIGTPQYMAPEQIEHPSEVDHRADIYALGVVFYQMLTGELPGKELQAPSKKVHIDVRLDEIVLQAMEKNPELRYQQARVMKTRVETIGQTDKPESASAASREYIRQSLRKPAIGLIASAVLQLFACFSLIAFALPAVGREGGDIGGYTAVMIMAGLSLTAAAVVLGGTVAMLRLRRLPLAVTASVVAMVAGPAAILGIPFGIWALRVLNRREVRETFEITPPIPTADRATRLIRLFLLCVPALLAIIFAIRAIFQQPLVVTGSRAESEIPLKQAGQSKRILAEYHWAKLAAEGRITGGTPVEVDGRSALKIENPDDTPLQLTLFNIETPPITGMRYTMSGEIKYEDVLGAGYMEMWSQFPQGRFFSRTLGAPGSGPMSQLAGTSGWREFSLPFDRTGTTSPPAQLEVNIFLPGRGTVFVGALKLTELESPRGNAGRVEPRASAGDKVAVEDLALRMIVAIREKDDDTLKSLATDRIKGWTEALPVFAVELREHYRQSTGNDAFDLRASESLVDGDLAVVRCTGPADLKGNCLALYFVKTNDGWRNHSLRATTEGEPLPGLLEGFKKQIQRAQDAATPNTEAPKVTEAEAPVDAVNAEETKAAAPETPEVTVANRAEAWLAGIDAGNYAQSWKDAADFFQKSITEAGWSEAMTKFRKPLGALKSRKLLNAQNAKSLPGAPDGDYVVMQFETSFAAKNKAVETVTFSLEKDGTWRASGYFIR